MPKAKRKKSFDMISIGDATLDLFVGIDEASVLCNLNKDVCLLCISYADKIAATSFERVIGGNAANNAVGSSRLGLKAAIYTVVGGDDTGRKVMEVMKRENVSADYLVLAKDQETNSSVVLNYKAERTILVYHVDRKYKMPKFKPTKWFYLTSMGKNHYDFHMEFVEYVKRTDSKLGFNPGTHQLKLGLEKLRPMLEASTVLFVNKEEAQRLVGQIIDMKELLTAMRHAGPKIVVITDGERGSFVFDGSKYWKCGITDTPVVERTGAGDAFGTAFLAALGHGKPIPEALRWGTMNSASVITKVGPEAGLLTKGQMQVWLRKYSKIKAKLF